MPRHTNTHGERLCDNCGSNRPRHGAKLCGACMEDVRQQSIQEEAKAVFLSNFYDMPDDATRVCLGALYTLMTGEEP
jgi:hypothetical protein